MNLLTATRIKKGTQCDIFISKVYGVIYRQLSISLPQDGQARFNSALLY